MVFTSQEQQNHEVRGSLKLGNVLLPLSVHSLSHHFQQTLHQACLHQLKLYHIWRGKTDKTFRKGAVKSEIKCTLIMSVS